MLAATAKIGSKQFIHVDVLQSIRSQLDQLPAKQKTMLDFRDAVAFLYPGLKGAVQKNYSKDEILQIIVKAGWAITHNSFRYLCSLFLSDDEAPCKKKSVAKSATRERHDSSRNTTKKINAETSAISEAVSGLSSDSADTVQHEQPVMTDTKTPDNISAPHEKENANNAAQSSAHFVLPPDTDDL